MRGKWEEVVDGERKGGARKLWLIPGEERAAFVQVCNVVLPHDVQPSLVDKHVVDDRAPVEG